MVGITAVDEGRCAVDAQPAGIAGLSADWSSRRRLHSAVVGRVADPHRGRPGPAQADHLGPSQWGDVQAFVADRADRYLDRPLAYDSGSGRILLRDLGLTMFGASPDNRGIEIRPVAQILADYARLQHATIGAATDASAAGLESWDPGRAVDDAAMQARQLHALPPSDARHISTAQRDRILDARSTIESAARVVAASPIPCCLEHGDLWPGNVIPPQDPDSSYRLIDFGDAAWSHPFLSPIMLIIECRFRWAADDQPDRLDLNHPAITATITDAYLSHWTDYASMPDLRHTLHCALQLAHYVEARPGSIPSLKPA